MGYTVEADGSRGWLVVDGEGRSLRAGDGPATGWHRGVGVRNRDMAEALAAAMNGQRLQVGETADGAPFIEGPELDEWAVAGGWD